MDELKRDYDYILLVCPPSLGMMTINALAAADKLTPLEDILGTDKPIDNKEATQQFAQSMLHPFKNHPFHDWQALENKRFGGKLEPSGDYYGDIRLGKNCHIWKRNRLSRARSCLGKKAWFVTAVVCYSCKTVRFV